MDAATAPTVRTAIDHASGVATVTLHRPERRNAISARLLDELRAALVELDAHSSVGAIVLTGADPAFCAGLDLDEVAAGGLLRGGATSASTPWTPTAAPMIAAVNGAAVTGGLELALNCDVIVAGERAVFADTHARVGVMPGWGLSVLLPRRVGPGRAVAMSLTGEFVSASEAERIGLVDRLCDHDSLLPTATGIAAAMAALDRDAVRTLLASYRRIFAAGGVAEGLALERATASDWMRTFSAEGVAGRRRDVIARGSGLAGGTPTP